MVGLSRLVAKDAFYRVAVNFDVYTEAALTLRASTRVNARRRASTRVQNAEIESGSNSASYCVGLDAV